LSQAERGHIYIADTDQIVRKICGGGHLHAYPPNQPPHFSSCSRRHLHIYVEIGSHVMQLFPIGKIAQQQNVIFWWPSSGDTKCFLLIIGRNCPSFYVEYCSCYIKISDGRFSYDSEIQIESCLITPNFFGELVCQMRATQNTPWNTLHKKKKPRRQSLY
jgi:hypothetical protein